MKNITKTAKRKALLKIQQGLKQARAACYAAVAGAATRRIAVRRIASASILASAAAASASAWCSSRSSPREEASCSSAVSGSRGTKRPANGERTTSAGRCRGQYSFAKPNFVVRQLCHAVELSFRMESILPCCQRLFYTEIAPFCEWIPPE